MPGSTSGATPGHTRENTKAFSFVKSHHPLYTLAPVPSLQSIKSRFLRSLQFPRPAFGISEGSVFFLSVVPSCVRPDELAGDPNLHGISHHPHLHLF
jgi:hypothetical protein